MNAPHDGKRTRDVDTPFGPVEITETRWNAGTDSEKWTVKQFLGFRNTDKDRSTGQMLKQLLESYSIAYQLANDGYSLEQVIDDATIIWTTENQQ